MDRKLKTLLLFSLITFSMSSFAQTYLLSNEISVFSFKTKSGKQLMLAKDKDNKYLVYRFGTKGKVELEFPKKNQSSWKKFKYTNYYRGGGKENEAQDFNIVVFTNENYKYRIYDYYRVVENTLEIGVEIINLKTDEKVDIKGKPKSKKGWLNIFRDNNLLEVGDEPL